MRITTAWAESLSQNLTLRFALLCLSVAFVFSALGNFIFFSQEPLVIDRGCADTPVHFADKKHTLAEIKAFLHIAIPMRFDTQSEVKNDYLSEQEIKNRISEQAKLKKQDIRQSVIIESVDVENGLAFADRIVRVGEVRSALSLQLQYIVNRTPRTRNNPYGLVLAQVEPYKPDSKKNHINK